MSKTGSWTRLKKVAEHRRDLHVRDLTRLVTERDEAQRKLELLIDYRNEYQGRLESAARSGIRGEGLLNYQRFLANLERAIEQQTDAMATFAQNVALAQRKVHVEHRKRESFQVLDERCIDAAEKEESKRQQKVQDELATRTRGGFTQRPY